MSKQQIIKQSKLPKRVDLFLHQYNYFGLVLAVFFFCLSQFPSLLPRSWFFQSLVAGIALAIGYGCGVLFSFIIRWLYDRDILVSRKKIAWRGLYVIGSLLLIIFLILGTQWQNQLRVLLHVEPIERSYLIRILLLSTLVGFSLIRLGRYVRRLFDRLRKYLNGHVPRRISLAISFVVVTICIIWVVSGAFLQFLGVVSSVLYDRKNRSTPEGITQPIEATRSGSNDSLIRWDTLGYQGQKFVANGPDQKQLQAFSNNTPKQQIRIYSGVNSANDVRQRAKLVVDEMKRTKAFERKILVVTIPTGTGWVNPQTVDALEYMYAGDTAIVAQQYSYLPSWISFLIDKQKAQDTGKALFDTVYAEWSKLPADERPKLIVYGLSLGAFGGQSSFSGPSSMVNAVDGALWQGAPGDTELWKEITRRRDKGTPEWQPVIDNGKEIRFASQNDDLVKNSGGENARVVYMQHGSDPIVWFNFDLPLHKPEWVSEKRAPDVMPNTIWIPFVTFFQIAADQVVGMNVPHEFGHNYETTVADAWAAVTSPDMWTKEKAEKLQSIINKY